ncbi:hypothetical protein PoB_005898600 [Plakobranchus ocellatus]|uniref:Uncharacterized protein n=1 Tax=Plakobranchus ocellatus TaxID=259542 RepID=A0AAV4CI06_9GAST|nr:hypothetical protein PoB_005898600 [Plakobranchus ocellatus]
METKQINSSPRNLDQLSRQRDRLLAEMMTYDSGTIDLSACTATQPGRVSLDGTCFAELLNGPNPKSQTFLLPAN